MKKTILITGSSGGIGSATCKYFFDSDWTVIGTDLKNNKYNPYIHHFIKSDLSKQNSLDSLIVKIKHFTTTLDALVLNAAAQLCKPIESTTLKEWDYIFSTNIRAPFYILKNLLPLLKKSNSASVINVGSVHSRATSKNISAYAASKGAISTFTRAAALELAEHQIRVNSVLPGAIQTTMLESGLKRGHLKGGSAVQLLKSLGLKHPLGRIGKPDEIAEAVYFLVNNAKFMTGQELVIDGGALSRLSTE
jgi:NAD(P)-dependent dehydrogenase (short-subunit alcohol dehydrogenase family)